MPDSKQPAPSVDEHFCIAQGNHEFLWLLRLSWAFTATYVVVGWIYGARLAASIDLVGAGVVWPFALWIFPRCFRATNYLLVISTTLYVIAGQVLIGREAGFAYYFLPIAVVPLLLFREDERRHVAVAIAIAFGGWLLAELGRVRDWGRPYRPIDLPAETLAYFNFLGASVLVMGFLIVYARANRRLRDDRVAQARRSSSELRDAFDRLASSERNLSEIFDVMAEAVWIMDAAGQIVRHNRAAERMWRMVGGTAVGSYDVRAWRMYDQAGELLDKDQMPSRRALITGQPQKDVVVKVRRATGAEAWLTVNAVPFSVDPPAPGSPTHVVTTVTDVTASKNARHLLDQIVNGTPDWIFIKGRDYRFVTVNNSFAASVGLTPAEMIGKNALEVGFDKKHVRGDPARGHVGFWNDDDRVFATGVTLINEAEAICLNGQERVFHTIKVPLYAEDPSRPHAVLGFSRDITHLKEVERRLVHSSKMASLGQMAGGIAHEINNPLAIIKATAQVLQMRLNDAPLDVEHQRAGLGRIVETTTRIAQIVRGLQTFSRDGEDDPFDRVDLTSLIEQAVALSTPRCQTAEVRLTVGFIPRVELDANAVQLGQVLINLLNNAVDAVRNESARWVRVDVDAGEVVTISISDGGPRIPDAVATKLMQPFFTTKAAGEGTGLGLMLAHKIVARHGGRLYLDRDAAHTRFVVELPRVGAN